MEWRSTFKMKDLLTDDESHEGAKKTAETIVKRLGETYPNPDPALQAIIELLSRIRSTDHDPLSRLNVLLDALYDLADINRVWIE